MRDVASLVDGSMDSQSTVNISEDQLEFLDGKPTIATDLCPGSGEQINPKAPWSFDAGACPTCGKYVKPSRNNRGRFPEHNRSYHAASLSHEWLVRAMEVMAASDAGFGSSHEDPHFVEIDSTVPDWPGDDVLLAGEVANQKAAQVSSPEDPTDSPADEDEDNSALPGAQAAFAEPDAWSVEEFGTEDPSETLTAELHDEPEGALPATDGAEDVPEGAPAWLDPRNSSKEVKDVDNMDIAAAARNYLMTSTAVKAFTYAEQQEIINEGEGVTASNLDRLQLEGTHYERLEEQIARAEAVGESIVWW